MSSPKKKLSTGPIRIDLPVSKREYSALHPVPAEDGAETSSIATQPNPKTEQEVTIPEGRKQDSVLPADGMSELNMLASNPASLQPKLEASIPAEKKQDSGLAKASTLEVSILDSAHSQNPKTGFNELEERKQDSSLPESFIKETSTLDSARNKQETELEAYIPEQEKQDSGLPEANMTQAINQDSALAHHETKLEAHKLEVKKQDSSLLESNLAGTSIQDSNSRVSEFPEATIEDSALESSPRIGYVSKSVSSESGIPESGLTETEYKKVAMRLSSEAVESLRQLRANTGVPYEILVDVMIRNWDNLPQRTRGAYLQQAKQVRIERLIAGQEKTMKTMRTKYLEH